MGCTRFAVGFSKKIFLANVLNRITTEIFTAQALSTPLAWLGAICYSLELFYDFSGYSDMAIGISNMFGIACPENFQYPYCSGSVSEFWRRWHITLGSWFRDYVYIPLGGSRVSKGRLYFNLLAVWLLTGIWHGTGIKFVLWGVFYFLFIALEKTFRLPERLPNRFCRGMYRAFTLLFINFQWVLFRSADTKSGLYFIKVMVSGINETVPNRRALFLLDDYGIFIVAAILFTMPVVPLLDKLFEKTRILKIIWQMFSAAFIVGFFGLSLSLVISGLNNPFAYANFQEKNYENKKWIGFCRYFYDFNCIAAATKMFPMVWLSMSSGRTVLLRNGKCR